jgi:ABC-type antimicrobial peptide transport system permease subunit
LTLLLAISREFHGSLVGTLLGDAVAVQVRTVDYVAVATTIALGGASVADVLYLNLRERSGEFATLRAVGWSRGSVDKLVGLEALGVGALGSVTGAVLGLLGAAALADGTFAPLLPAAGLAAAAGLVVTIVAGLAPLRGLRRLPVPVLLAEE